MIKLLPILLIMVGCTIEPENGMSVDAESNNEIISNLTIGIPDSPIKGEWCNFINDLHCYKFTNDTVYDNQQKDDNWAYFGDYTLRGDTIVTDSLLRSFDVVTYERWRDILFIRPDGYQIAFVRKN